MFEETRDHVLSCLKENYGKWEKQYAGYADDLAKREEKIMDARSRFRQWKPLFVYTNVSETMKGAPFQLRYRGQFVANLRIGKGGFAEIGIGDDQKKTNGKNFPRCPVFDWIKWDDDGKAKKFRQFFGQYPDRKGGGKVEHRLESHMLSELEKRLRKEKLPKLCNIRPVKLFDRLRFQFPTPLKAGDVNNITYSDKNGGGGGIDILARIKSGRQTNICVLEMKKDAKESIAEVLKQGLAYAVFVRELLRSKSGEKWYRLLGFNKSGKGTIPSDLLINVVAVMPGDAKALESFRKSFPAPRNEVGLGADGQTRGAADKAVFHCIFFKESDDKRGIEDVWTSLGKDSTVNG